MYKRQGELSVNFIGDHHDVGSPQNFGDGLQVLSGHNAAGGIAREGKDQNFCLRRNGAFQLPGGEAELILGLELQIYGGASGHGGQRTVAHEGLSLIHILSGTGPTVFGLFADGECARLAFNALRETYRETFLTHTM